MTDAVSVSPDRVQLLIRQPYRIEIRTHHQVRGYLDRGYLIEDLQHVTDQEVLVTLVDGSGSPQIPG